MSGSECVEMYLNNPPQEVVVLHTPFGLLSKCALWSEKLHAQQNDLLWLKAGSCGIITHIPQKPQESRAQSGLYLKLAITKSPKGKKKENAIAAFKSLKGEQQPPLLTHISTCPDGDRTSLKVRSH